MQRILLSRTGKNAGKYFALVDDEDYERINSLRWSAIVGSKRVRAQGKIVDHAGKERTVSLHRYLLQVSDPDIKVDHIDHDPLNNTRANLRLCSNAENCRNIPRRVDNQSGFKGVWWYPRRRKYQAYIRHNYKRFHLGLFVTAEQAAVAYDTAARKYFGEFAWLNFPDETSHVA